MTVRAPVLERDRRAVLEAIEYDRLAENDPAERLALISVSVAATYQ